MIKLIIEEHYSNPDIYGNRYWSTSFIDATNKSVLLQYSDNTNNAKYYARQAGFEWDELYSTEIAHPIREFNKHFKYEYLSSDEIKHRLKRHRQTKEIALDHYSSNWD